MNDDLNIYKSIKTGDSKALKELFNIYFEGLVHYSVQIVNNTSDAEEIVQDIFVSIWQKRGSLLIEHSVKAYLYSAVKYRSINHLRSKYMKLSIDITEELIENTETEIDGFSELSLSELNEIVEAEINRLPEKCRIIYLLSRNAGLTHKQIAQELEIAEKTVENQITIALKRILACIKKSGYETPMFLRKRTQ